MTEELYIDGVLMDMLEGGEAVQLVYQSPYYTDIEAIVSNRTNEIVLPLTGTNRRVLGYVGAQAISDAPYRRHRGIYRRDGVELLRGEAVLLGITSEGISLNLVWGNADIYQPLFDTNLRELMDWDDTSHFVNRASWSANDVIHYGAYRMRYGIDGARLPVLPFYFIRQRITTVTGVQLGTSLDRYCIALASMQGGENEQVTTPSIGYSSVQPTSTLLFHRINKATGTTDKYGRWDGTTHAIDVHDCRKVRLVLSDTLTYHVIQSSDSEGARFLVCAVQTGGDYSVIKRLGTQTGSAGDWSVTLNAGTYEVTMPSGTQSIVLCLASSFGYSAIASLTANIALTIIPDNLGVIRYPLYANLPDISVGDLVKSLLLASGRFAWNSGGQIVFASVADLYDRRSGAKDWTEKIASLNVEREWTFGAYAKRNWLRYAETDDVSEGANDGCLLVDNDLLAEEQELGQSVLGGVQDGLIRVFSVGEDGGVEFKESAARLLWIDSETAGSEQWGMLAQFEGLEWLSIIAGPYSRYQQMIRRPVVLRCEMCLTTADLHALDMTKPVYLRQTGQYYAILSLTSVGAGMADVELIQM